ncbi:UDP-N-acetylmuramate--L-alanine ligase [Clostridium sp. MSJ-4]|uniref:UDP-N-acetylmuramate--L-alanine ligase n=1 Tax=Clostridium simiarum TaxID=2841506 RepID=A0ABS6F1I7_9CLOT|nr:UDP-N-acetylmuramate--L-alanine ligase [Clostridium simiarum]MBU5592113.1 UDP-N-acetylmuramate--L-alanine ligase [Clostridium simiarum]
MSFDFLKDKNKKIHFIGIGGISMSGLAAIMLKNNFKVSGSDMKDSEILNKLRKKGAEIYIGHSDKNIKDVDLVVYTAAVPKDNPELQYSIENQIPLMDRAEFLGEIMKGHKYNVAVSGTHGKTTSTSMLAHITLKAELDPTILVGAELDIIDGNFRTGNSEYFVTESCEYKKSFLKFFPYIGIILNIDADHLDYYKDIDHIESAFTEFGNLIPEDGYLIGYAGDPRVMNVVNKVKCSTLTYGIDCGDIQGRNISFNDKGQSHVDVYRNDEKLFSIVLGVPGNHNILNALSAVATSLILGIDHKAIIEGLESFKGAHKRFEFKGEKKGITVIDDYAHHPTEIKATLDAAKNYPHNKIYCVFQPHTYSRTLALLEDFTLSFDNADEILLMDIYAAREKDTGLVSSDMLGDKIRKRGLKCTNLRNFDEALTYLNSKASKGDLILTVGAGDVVKVGEMFLHNK